MAVINTQSSTVVGVSIVFALCANTFVTAEAHAELGGTSAALAAGDTATVRTLPGSAAKVRSTVDAGGTTINEYTTGSGVIFAYTWQGPTMPDLGQLLGPYAQRLRTEAAAQFNATGSLHASRVDDPDVIIESGGQMRSYVGRAWLPQALPAGITQADLR
ncbi:DUF2844 domain-containing protein [Paraburkholderia sp. C35]|uniref:DUF2844 domain-containing protein n=1 Tax=Paraburkholderia sp. C35 TaxID=2126993 RepID=UPI000D69ACC0|nr:DUF2844 domain-containing protein [Paraburkholderia sp. C35]